MISSRTTRKTIEIFRITVLLLLGSLSLMSCVSVPTPFNELMRDRIEGIRHSGECIVEGERIAALNQVSTLYENNGFIIVGERPDYYRSSEGKESAIVMRLGLD